jgi:oxygen-independent coproporphyrinogen-3 oxidase
VASTLATVVGPRPLGRLEEHGVRHLYVHLPFCAHRCGYCDFVTVVGRGPEHEPYVDALLAELALEQSVLAEAVETVYLGGGTPTFLDTRALARLLAALPAAEELTVEANPETMTPELARLLRSGGVTRVSLGAQSFQQPLLTVLERRAGPDDVRRAVRTLRRAGFDNVSLDLIYGIPGQSAADLERDLAEAVALEPEHLSCYELEAKPGTRFTRTHARVLARQAEAMEHYFELVVDTLTAEGYRWYETANFCRRDGTANSPDVRSRHNLAYWQAADYLGIGVGAVSTLAGTRRRNRPALGAYVRALRAGSRPPRELELLDAATRARERLLLALRLDELVPLADVGSELDLGALRQLAVRGLVEVATANGAEAIRLTRRGRFLGDAVTADLLA